MKKLFKLISAFAVMALVFGIFAPAAFAEEAGEISVSIDGVAIDFEGNGPALVDGRTLVPVRGVFEALGFDVDWDAEAQVAAITNEEFELIVTIGSSVFTTNGEDFELDVEAQIIDGRTMLPIRALLESIGLVIGWDEDNQVVLIRDELRGFVDFTPNPNAIENQLAEPQDGDLIAILHTTMGDIHIRLFPQYAPLTVENFVTHAQNGLYDGVIFHRVISNFMNQTGDPTGTGMGGESIWGVPFGDELSMNLRHVRGAVSMAHAGPATNGSQFFIVQRWEQPEVHMERIEMHLADADSLIPARPPEREFRSGDVWPEGMLEWYLENGGTYHLDFNHAVFGQVFEGMDVVEAIEAVEKGEADRPLEDVVIERITIFRFGEE